jgi:uncharacterized SAM-binding protein YcdF (DUF218 family)
VISEQAWADAERLWEFHRMGHRVKPCSVALGLGSHDIGVAEVAADLYLKGLAPLIVFTGATSPTTRSRMPLGEAVHYRDRAIERGVPADRVLLEPRARNTGENITFSRDLLEAADVPVTSVLLVSKPYEERRAYATACKLWPDVEFVSASAPDSFERYVDFVGDPRLVVDMMVGALERLLAYPAQGFMIPQQVPDDVVHAFRRLCREGFTSRLVAPGGTDKE